MLIEDRRRNWVEHGRNRPIHKRPSFIEDRLELGAGTVLARLDRARRGNSAPMLGGQEQRILALLGAAYERPIPVGVLDNFRRAARQWAKGEACLAHIHLALAGLPRFDPAGDGAYRLFMADRLLKSGVPPRDILRALDLDPTPVDRLDKGYDPDEPRVSAGSGRESGEWTTGGGAGGDTLGVQATGQPRARGGRNAAAAGDGHIGSEDRARGTAAAGPIAGFLETASESMAGRLAAYALRLGSGAAALGLLLIPSRGPRIARGPVSGASDLEFSWSEDETQLRIWRETGAQTELAMTAEWGPGGIFTDQRQRVVGRQVGDSVIIDAAAVRDDTTKDDDPKLCPAPDKDTECPSLW